MLQIPLTMIHSPVPFLPSPRYCYQYGTNISSDTHTYMCSCDTYITSLCVLFFGSEFCINIKGMHSSVCKLFPLNNMPWRSILISTHNILFN